ncbi:MAG: hypothetical protein R2794_09465 [Chitinophagales bacterium]
MKRPVLLLAFLGVLSFCTVSCQKCTVCTAQTIDGDQVVEYCGTEYDVSNFETTFIDSLGAIMIPAYCERGPQ